MRGPVARNIGHVDHGQVGHPLLQLSQPRAHELLPLLGHVILGVLAEIAHSHGLLQFLRQFVIQLVFEDRDFLG